MVDASFVDVPGQRNSRENNKEIKEGGIPEIIHTNFRTRIQMRGG